MKISPAVDAEAYCFKCKKKVKATFTELIDDGKRARLAGTCKVCGTKTNRIISRADIPKYKGGRSGGCDCPYSGSDADKKEPAAAADASDFGVMGGARRRKSRGSRKSGSRKSRKSHSRKSGSRKSRKSHSRKSGSRKSRHSRKTGSRKSRGSRHSRK
jgi:hypothetical protein